MQISKFKRKDILYSCKCGCGDYARPGKKYIQGHDIKMRKWIPIFRETIVILTLFLIILITFHMTAKYIKKTEGNTIFSNEELFRLQTNFKKLQIVEKIRDEKIKLIIAEMTRTEAINESFIYFMKNNYPEFTKKFENRYIESDKSERSIK